MPKYQYKYRRPQRRRLRLRWVLLAVALVGALAYPFWEATLLRIDEHTVYVTGLDANLRNLRIVYASDIHQCAWFGQERVNALIQTLNSLNADLILLGGDYATDSTSAIAFFQNAPRLQARLGVFGVLGNHDRTQPEENLGVLMAQMTSYGCLPLVNTVSEVRVGQGRLYIAGVDDCYNGFPDVAGVAAQVQSDDFFIFLGHSPDLMPDVLAARSADGRSHWYDLALFGHTHGGQVNLLGFTPFVRLAPGTGARYLSGWLEENRASVLVSNGVGTSNLPMRFLAVPQIHLITLKAQ